MARKLKTDEEVGVGAAHLKHKAPKENVEMETKSEMVEVEAEGLLADAASDCLAQNAHDQCGGALRASRIEQDISTQAVAKQLRMGNAQIEALENNNFAVLPEPTIVKGFIRNYAKLLKIPAEPILAAYAELMPKKEQYAYTVGRGINMKISDDRKSTSLRYLIWAILFLLGLGVWFFYQQYIQKPDAINQTPVIAEMLPAEATLQMNAQEGELAAIDTQEMTDEIAETDVAIAQSTVNSVAAENEIGAEIEAVAEPQNDAEKITAKKAIRFEFNATQETWISIVNKSGDEVYNKTLYAGNRDIIEIEQPSEVTVGNAKGATLIVDGKPISLAPYTRLNIARVRLNP